jgi:glycosyltransferase involved in cell wall biosynthesis
MQENSPGFGFNLIGFATANFGTGVALRNTAAVLKRAGFPFCVLDIDPGGNRTGHDFSTQSHAVRAGEKLPYPVNLFHMNPPHLEGLFRDLPDLVQTRGRMNVCVPFWELPRLPLSWKAMLEAMDLVLAPSLFIKSAVDEVVTGTPCLYYKQAFSLPEAVPDRERWGLPPGKTVFLFSFDISSGIQRKNPLAVMEAFQSAFPGGDAVLLVKINNPGLNAEAGMVVDRFKAMAAQVPGVRILDRSLDFTEVVSLYASADVFVSLHRGEGLGLGMMESMALGKPVIATGWSGNMDFMDEDNSCLVPYQLVPVAEGSQYQAISRGVDQVWAEPSVEAAAGWMARLAASPGLRLEIGMKAKNSLTRHLHDAFQAIIFREIQSRYGIFAATVLSSDPTAGSGPIT